MKLKRSGAWLVLALIAVALLVVSCAPAASQTPGPTQAPAQAEATSATQDEPPAEATPAAETTAAGPTIEVPEIDIPVGVDDEGNFYRGDPNAPVKMVEFSEFQCPFCARHFMETEPLLRADYISTGEVQHVFRHFPLEFHPNALPASKAAVCAGQQDPQLFWDMHDWLFTTQNDWSALEDASSNFRDRAIELGADEAEFDTCVADPETEAAITEDVQEGAAMGVSGTPAFFVNDWFISGAVPFADFETAIQRAQEGIHPPPTATPLPEGVLPYDVNPDRPAFTYDNSPSLGAADAPLILIAFQDYRCADCVLFHNGLESDLREQYADNGELRIVFNSLPVEAPSAAVAGVCAARQEKFWEYYDLLFDQTDAWEDDDEDTLVSLAGQADLDEDAFRECLSDPSAEAEVENDVALAQQLGAQFVPFLVLLDVEQQRATALPGTLSLEEFEQALDELQNPPTPTPAPAPAETPTPAS